MSVHAFMKRDRQLCSAFMPSCMRKQYIVNCNTGCPAQH